MYLVKNVLIARYHLTVSSLHAFIYKICKRNHVCMLACHLEITVAQVSIPTGKEISVGFYIKACTAYLHWHIPDLVFHSDLPKYNLDSRFVL